MIKKKIKSKKTFPKDILLIRGLNKLYKEEFQEWRNKMRYEENLNKFFKR